MKPEQVIKSKEEILQEIKGWTSQVNFTEGEVLKAMEAYASQFEWKQGWVKASVRLPKVDGVYFIRCYHNGKICLRKTAVLDDSHFLEVIYQDGYGYDDFEWLDESADNPTVDSIRVKEAKERHKLQEENERLRQLIEQIYKQSETEMHQELGHNPDEYESVVQSDWEHFKTENNL